MHRIQRMWEWPGLCHMHTPKQRKSQPEACPGATLLSSLDWSSHPCVYTWESVAHTFQISSNFPSLPVCPSLLPIITPILEGASCLRAKPSPTCLHICAPRLRSGSVTVCPSRDWAMSWAGPGRGYSGTEVLLAVTLFHCCNKTAAAGDMGAVTWLCSNKVLLTNTGRGPDGQH